MLAEADKWQAVGSQNLAPQVDTTPVVISFSADAPIPTITITPPVDQPGVPTPPTSPGASCATKAKGDCSCDGKVTVVDWEMLRKSIRSEGQSCDPNGDGTINSVDLSIWKNNHE